jgi:NTE family protein
VDAEDRVEMLSFSPIFRALDIEDQRHLAEAFQPVHLSAGTTLMLEGDEATSLYLVQTGRLRVFVHRGETQVPVGVIGPGEVVGEMALLSDLNRSATVIAMRDSALLELSREVFDDLVVARPGLLLELARLLVTRLHRTSGATHVGGDARSVVLLPVDGAADTSLFARELATALGSDTLILDRHTVTAALGSDSVDVPLGTRRDIDFAQWLHRVEIDHDVVVYVADLDLTSWTRRCLRQADLVLLVSTADGGGIPTAAESEVLWGVDVAVRPRAMLVIVHSSSTEQPSGTSRLLERRSIQLHHHLRSGSSADFARLARVITGRAVALVLGGGGLMDLPTMGCSRR